MNNTTAAATIDLIDSLSAIEDEAHAILVSAMSAYDHNRSDKSLRRALIAARRAYFAAHDAWNREATLAGR